MAKKNKFFPSAEKMMQAKEKQIKEKKAPTTIAPPVIAVLLEQQAYRINSIAGKLDKLLDLMYTLAVTSPSKKTKFEVGDVVAYHGKAYEIQWIGIDENKQPIATIYPSEKGLAIRLAYFSDLAPIDEPF